MFSKKSASLAGKDRVVICPLCRSDKVDSRIYGEGGRFECRKCGAVFTIEAIPKTDKKP
jgi:transposase-like protein